MWKCKYIVVMVFHPSDLDSLRSYLFGRTQHFLYVVKDADITMYADDSTLFSSL